MVDLASRRVRPLKSIENHFLQVLVTSFRLLRHGTGSDLTIRIGDEDLALCSDEAKYEVRGKIPDFASEAVRYQRELDEFLLKGKGKSYSFKDPLFPFRYASGGALPVLRLGDTDYYCLFYRDIFPIGWNIANGGCDSRAELLNPFDTVARELREELVVLHHAQKKRYVFGGDDERSFDRPEHEVARRIWQSNCPGHDIESYEPSSIPLVWIDGPDRLEVKVGSVSWIRDRCFLNINAEDFGIEIDRIARIHLDPDVVLLDGELRGDRIVNRVVGLFEVDSFNGKYNRGERAFMPDFFFFGGKKYDGCVFENIVSTDFADNMRSLREPETAAEYESCTEPFALCPVTRRIIARYLAVGGGDKPSPLRKVDTFICFGGETDGEIASDVYEYLRGRGMHPFFSGASRSPSFLRVIDSALDSADSLVAVSTHPDNLWRGYVQYEWETFLQDILEKRKPEATMLSMVSGFEPADLPRPFRREECIKFDRERLELSLERLVEFLPPYGGGSS